MPDGAHGLVKQMSEAPKVQRRARGCRYVQSGSMPHARGSSSLIRVVHIRRESAHGLCSRDADNETTHTET